jgi:hypothetical protein
VRTHVERLFFVRALPSRPHDRPASFLGTDAVSQLHGKMTCLPRPVRQYYDSRYHQGSTKLFERAQPRIARSITRLMSDRKDFEIVCPNDHNQTVTFGEEEFEETLKAGALVFHCNTCDTDWSPSHEDIAKIRRQMSKNSS